jgi:hypothetical protein
MPATRGTLGWAASLSVCIAGWLIAHALAYRLLASGDGSHGTVVEASGHGQMAFSPSLMTVSAAVLLLAFACAVVAGARGRTPASVPVAPFALLPLLDFVCHTALESLQHGEVSAGAALEPVFLLGLAIQLPLALGALLLMRAAQAWAEGLGRGLTPRWRPRALPPASPALLRLLLRTEHRPVISALASGCAERGPPVSAAV